VNLRHVLHVFRKDGIEILRDRRTLFVNVVLPALLYPLIALFMLQVTQLTRNQVREAPRVALVDVPGRAAELLARPLPGREGAAKDQARRPPRVATVALPSADTGRLRTLALELDAVPKDEEERARRLRGELLEQLRAHGLAGAVVLVPREEAGDPARWLALYDTADARHDQARDAVDDAAADYGRELAKQRLADAGLPASLLAPVTVATSRLASVAEEVRTRISGMIPLLLVILAAVGAFYPAIDLIAGERERGTLESLLSWPVARRDLFLGKLLVTCAAAGASVVLNLASLALTMALAGRQLAQAGADLGGALSTGLGSLAVCVVVLVPLTLTLGALSLALAGLAASAKEAQNYLSPMLLVVMVAALVAAVPEARPSLALDLIPITGSVLALKESLQGHHLPWLHLLLATGSSVCLAAVVVGWATRLLDSEKFRYPGLVRAGWGRFRRWGERPAVPDGVEAMGVFALAVAGMTLGAGMFLGSPVPLMIGGPLLLFVLGPALAHAWLGGYRRDELFSLRTPSAIDAARGLVAVPFAILVSLGIASLQGQPPAGGDGDGGAEKLLSELASYGVLVELLCAAVAPAVCEELLCRGTLLAGLKRSLGPGAAAVVSAFLFAALHLSPYRFLPQFALGIALAALTLRTRSIGPAMLLHAGHNGAVLLIERGGHGALLEGFHPLAALALGAVGLVAVIGMRRRPAA
jgi:sodium transport system permease protein